MTTHLDFAADSGAAVFESMGVNVGDSDVTTVAHRSPRLPVSVPREQLYYWSRVWQEHEAEAIRDIEQGETRRFTSSTDAIRWLLDETDD